jgi:hypothetical protein
MKKLIALLILISILTTAASAELYARNATVIETDVETSEVVAVDYLGQIWAFYSEDAFEWDPFDSCILIFDSGEVVACTYTGQADIETIIWICQEIL